MTNGQSNGSRRPKTTVGPTPGPISIPAVALGHPRRTTKASSKSGTASIANAFTPMRKYAPFWRPRLPNPLYAFALAHATSRLQRTASTGTTTLAVYVASKSAGFQAHSRPMSPVRNTAPTATASTPAGTVDPMSSRGSIVTAALAPPVSTPIASQPGKPNPNVWEATRPPAASPIDPKTIAAGSPAVSLGDVSTNSALETTPNARTPEPETSRSRPRSSNSPIPSTRVSRLTTSERVSQANRNVRKPRPATTALAPSSTEVSPATSRVSCVLLIPSLRVCVAYGARRAVSRPRGPTR